MDNAFYKVNLLYPTEKPLEPGIILVTIEKPHKNKLPIEVKSLDEKDILKYIPQIAKEIQDQILDRININILVDVDFIVEYQQKKYHVYFNKSVDEFKLE
ncbi:hypothetical protein ACAG39_06765 [Caldicellulosiruptoraceae bacterium PP1]